MRPFHSVSVAALVGLTALVPQLALAAPAPTAAAAADGGALFRMRCQSCHSVIPGATSPLAPNLADVVGRRAAATAFRYSDALKQSGVTWSRANLDRYLSGPMQMIPGTRMVIKVSNPAERAAIIAYLAGPRR